MSHENKSPRPICNIADEIISDWKKPNFGAVPYLDAMRSLSTLGDYYIHDSATSVVSYFLANATTWKGATAKRIKKELNDMLAEYRRRHEPPYR